MAGLSFPGCLALDCQVQHSVAVYVTPASRRQSRGRLALGGGRMPPAQGLLCILRDRNLSRR